MTNKVPKEEKARNKKLYKKHLSGLTFAELGKEFGISTKRAWTIVKKMKGRLEDIN